MDIDYSVNIGYNDFRTQIMTVEDLLYRFNETDATTSVALFRRPTQAQSSRIIESVLLGMPQPMLYIDDTSEERVVIEGADRMYAYYAFCKKGLQLSSLYFKKDQYEGRTFSGLSPLAQSNILNTKIIVNVLNPGLTPHERFGVYLCLKSRIDATSLQWCRIKIFGKKYQWIKDLARSVSVARRTESIESLICYMLVGEYYQLFLKGGGLTQIDAAANMIMEQVYDGGFVSGIEDIFRQVLISYFKQRRQIIIQPKAVALYLSVLYNLYKENGNSKNAEKFFNEEVRKYYALLRTDDSAETFSRVISEILTRIR
jgi:hypothetical protein